MKCFGLRIFCAIISVSFMCRNTKLNEWSNSDFFIFVQPPHPALASLNNSHRWSDYRGQYPLRCNAHRPLRLMVESCHKKRPAQRLAEFREETQLVCKYLLALEYDHHVSKLRS